MEKFVKKVLLAIAVLGAWVSLVKRAKAGKSALSGSATPMDSVENEPEHAARPLQGHGLKASEPVTAGPRL